MTKALFLLVCTIVLGVAYVLLLPEFGEERIVAADEWRPAHLLAFVYESREWLVDLGRTADAGGFRVGGCAKGVGMISPNLATMLAFVTTDAHVSTADLDLLTRERQGGNA